MKVVVTNHCPGLRVDRKLLTRLAGFVTRQHGITLGQIELAIFDDAHIAGLHKKYFHRRAVTDVICFDLTSRSALLSSLAPKARESSSFKAPGLRAGGFLVTLALGGQVARRQARLRKTSINKELALYAVHGLLHALGYNDDTANNAQRMHQHEDELLTKLGLGPVYGKL